LKPTTSTTTTTIRFTTASSPPRALSLTFALALLAFAAHAAEPQRPLPFHSPEAVVPPGLRVHVRASEDLDPDRLRSFARPGVTLWLLTRSNQLRASTLENLNRFDAAFVRVKPPFNDDRLLDKAPRAGVWVDEAALASVARVRGPRPLAVDVAGPLDDARTAALRAAKPDVIDWAAPAEPDLLMWGLFRSLPGHKLVASEHPLPCEARLDREPAAHVNVASLLALSASAFPCGPGPRITIAADTDLWLVQSIVVKDPSAELELNAPDDATARRVAKLLDAMGLTGRR
jgi:hypothetical protein